jgi:hypothetical protein
MKPGERIHPRPVMTDAQRLHYHGRLRPMQQPSWRERLLRRLGL